MAKKTENQVKAKPAPKAAEPEIEIETSDSSDDEQIEVEGLEDQIAEATSKSGHVVNVTTEQRTTSSVSGKKRGVVYIGRLPAGFAEYELKKYFTQFGDILRVRVSRNKKTGASRHYAFLEFKEFDVAKVAADTMNNYLLMGHLLKVHVIDEPKDNLFPAKMKSSFREFDWRAKEYKEFHEAKPLDTWKQLQLEFEVKKEEKLAELKDLGFDYALEA